MNLNIFKTSNLYDASKGLFEQLGIKLNSNTALPLSAKNDILKQYYKTGFDALIGETFYVGTIDDTMFEASKLFDTNYSYTDAVSQAGENYNGLMLFAVNVKLDKHPTRTDISELTRAFNHISQKMPVGLLLKYKIEGEPAISLALSERFLYKQAWREGEKVGKVIILRDILVEKTHAGHLRILQDLVKPAGITTYNELHTRWLEVLDVELLNKKFFQELSNWYFWAMGKVQFPDDKEKNEEMRNATNLIRLITRIIFIWFIKEKGLIGEKLFYAESMSDRLKDFNKDEQSHNYYNAILQNLFFGTLNQKMGEERKFAKDGGNVKTNVNEYGVKNVYRYANLFTISEKEAQVLFKDVPFLNGGLFDCLDKENADKKVEYVDGFSRNTKKQAIIPDYLFFGNEQDVDLNSVYDTKGKNYKTKGLIHLLNSYKFTIAENTPMEEDVALDPELLGKVFENLLASYNPETKTTARKQTGSFYTPREIVNYMVDESLIAYLKIYLNKSGDKGNELENKLRQLLEYNAENPFKEDDAKVIIKAINSCKILDPACGSGAFPMGILHKMVNILQKIDPENHEWRKIQEKKAGKDANDAFKIEDQKERDERLKEISDIFEHNSNDYGRKLFLIENCIFGVDIQPIAVQIAKLRFFISLIIDQKVDPNKENFGIRSLPNLETKFVAANTLIGLEKPKQLMIHNLVIDDKETELKENRHKYFTANNRTKKLKLQENDKRLRKEIATLLKADGWDVKVAEQIVAFDPYDQNSTSPFFDPEWMFGLAKENAPLNSANSGGYFDVVIGNPPYVSLKSDNIYSKFETFKSLELYAYFFEKGIWLLKKNGVISFITGSLYIKGVKFVSLRNFLTKNADLIHLQNKGDNAFENVKMPTTIFIGKKSMENQWDFDKFNSGNSLLQNIETNTIKLSDISKMIRGLEFGRDKILGNGEIPFITGSNICKYGITKLSFIDKNTFNEFSKDKYYFTGERILLRETGSQLMVIYLRNELFSNRSLFNIKITNKNFSPKFVLGCLNSKLLQFYYQTKFKANSELFPKIRMIQAKELPIPNISLEKQQLIITLVEQILQSKEQNADTSALEKEIDRLVYKLYVLTYDEVKIIEPEFAMSEEKYDIMSL